MYLSCIIQVQSVICISVNSYNFKSSSSSINDQVMFWSAVGARASLKVVGFLVVQEEPP